jgi:hypothetical protein
MTKTGMVEIPKTEYDKLKELSALKALDVKLVSKVLKALKNYKQGKFKEWA